MSADTCEDSLPDVAAQDDEEPEVSDGRARLMFVVLPAIALALGALAGYLSWQSAYHRAAALAATDSVAVAREAAAAILSYNADTVETDLNSARDRLTGSFLEEYTKLVNEVVIPGSREKAISAVADVPAAASVSATLDHAVALVYVDQTVTIGGDTPTNTASSVKVTLDRVEGQWLVSGFEPV